MYPRANTLGIIINKNKILLEEQEGKHSKGTGTYYRPIGGTIELGEKSSETIIREYREEIAVDIVVKRYIACLENIFRIEGSIGHEITQIYLVEFIDQNLYEKESFKVIKGSKTTFTKWISLEEIIDEKKILYPNGLKELLQKNI
ncbi:NUDIX domain-containing protein [Psychrobacillus sp. INOP01]|uniref:NUDIX hydrolase n=1 Tax=Psychrobacillus sp. INOP01 TaxID=2829187 RepID=UPI001BADA8D8|nr:NUDIX domain-containing protein [Psychrobacillus sp. INOP01]QUG41664.1 NUDIX domain-containing protein [Psychrobacillus sp. INOP01]